MPSVYYGLQLGVGIKTARPKCLEQRLRPETVGLDVVQFLFDFAAEYERALENTSLNTLNSAEEPISDDEFDKT